MTKQHRNYLVFCVINSRAAASNQHLLMLVALPMLRQQLASAKQQWHMQVSC